MPAVPAKSKTIGGHWGATIQGRAPGWRARCGQDSDRQGSRRRSWCPLLPGGHDLLIQAAKANVWLAPARSHFLISRKAPRQLQPKSTYSPDTLRTISDSRSSLPSLTSPPRAASVFHSMLDGLCCILLCSLCSLSALHTSQLATGSIRTMGKSLQGGHIIIF